MKTNSTPQTKREYPVKTISAHLKTSLLSAFLFAGVAGQATAMLLAYEGFDYTAGSQLSGQNGGTGWDGSWGVSNSARAIVLDGGLSYLNLVVSGNSVGNPDTTSSFSVTRLFDSAPDSGTVYFSFLVHGDETVTGRYGALLRPAAGGTSPVAMGQSTSQSLDGTSPFSMRENQTNQGGINGANPGGTSIVGTNFLVVELNLDTNQASYWANPTSLGGAAPTATVSGVSFTSPPAFLEQFYFGTQDSGSAKVIYDEFRIGTTYASVSPIPEPSTLLLVFGAFTFLVMMGRRRK
ncbi:MAG: PEP-CTERM sorting domain-containing protein [Verrucomicrobia bacterium]|nr:PEP-CTERM sorting domain-containing protein [Verrucomicrobiota bacterium]MCH8525534.1 PEP-CTERM sorting domain-containing protein [Kiritimatiellia bacterium]